MSITGWTVNLRSWLVCLCLLLAQTMVYAQKKSVGTSPDATRKVIIDKARMLEQRGRPDMAVQLWQQILLSDPKNSEALSGVARDYKLVGNAEKASEALDKLRHSNPNDPNISKIAQMSSTHAESERLRQAGALARQGKLEDAMRVYRELYGEHPPDGDIALAYYQTLYGTSSGKEQAIKAMRTLALRNPADSRFAVELAIMLTYDARTRAEGMRILREHPQSANAQAGLRQALLWEAANPSSAGSLRQYLKDHPQDQEIAQRLKEDEGRLAQMNSGLARTPEERAAFAALNAHHLEEAKQRFQTLLSSNPANSRAQAGLGFVSMQENDFGSAITYLTQAEENGFKDRTVENALGTSRFWFTMKEASQAFDDNQLDVAAAKYRAALAMRPHSPEALSGMAGLLVKEQQYPAAAALYEDLVKQHPAEAEAWRGLFLSWARGNQNQKALAVVQRIPAAPRMTLSKDPEYLRTLAAVEQAMNRDEDARRTLELALSLPFPADGGSLQTDTRLQYAGILTQARRYDQASAIYVKILNEDMSNLPAWEGLIGAHHQMGQDSEAVRDVERMPPAVYETALSDPAFLDMLGGIYQQANQFEVAQGFLERSEKIQVDAGGQPPLTLQLQLAGLYLVRNDSAKAYFLYRQILTAHPESEMAWKGLIASMISTHHEAEALQEIAQIPAPVRRQLEGDIEFVQGEASAYAITGDNARAIETMNRVMAHYTASKTTPPANVEIQNAWLLYNTKNDRGLYPALMRLGARRDLTPVQRETVQTLWASWAVRRASVALENNNSQRAVDILESAAAAFPENITVRKAVAGGYAQVGRAKEAMALFKSVPMQDASAGDFQGAVGAALAAGDRTMAEQWLRQALERYPRDPAILQMAARYEQARGDSQRAADYYRASLAVMPKSTPANRLAHVLAYPEEDARVRKANSPADLQRILNPDYEPFQRTAKLPPLPAYGADPLNSAPVVLGDAPSGAPQNDWSNAPALPPAPGVNAVSPAAPEAEAPAPQSNVQTPSAQVASLPDSKASRRKAKKYSGEMHLTPSQQKIITPSFPKEDAEDHSLAKEMLPESVPAQVNSQPTHTLAGDAWKGLIFSLLADHKTAEAQSQIAQIPADLRRQLDADVEFQQAEANLYAQLGDNARAGEYMKKVQDYYALRRMLPPPQIAIQNAWLLYNSGNDNSLYSALDALDARRDLTAEQRQQEQTLWANWSVRRAAAEMERGNSQQGLRILDAALAQYPANADVRLAIAGGYTRVGQAHDAMAIYRTADLQKSSADQLQGAISAAISVKDMKQAEVWLRQALNRFPSAPGVLAAAAGYEQARGNQQRASDYWRAAIAATPPGSSLQKYNALPVDSGEDGGRPAARPGELKQMLAPGNLFVPLPAQSGAASRMPSAPVALRITSEPMEPIAASAQALFAAQTDGQLTRGSAASIDALPAPPIGPALQTLEASSVHYALSQYTPSAQDAVSGAYSAPLPKSQQSVQQALPAAVEKVKREEEAQNAQTASPVHHKKAAAKAAVRSSAQPRGETPTLRNAPATLPANQIEVTDLPGAPAPATTQGLTDEELQQRDLPPLRGPWVRVQRQKRDLSPRDEAELQLRTIESSYSGWLGGSGIVNYRSGTPGYDRLAALEAPMELSMPLGYAARLTIIARPVFLDSGQADGNAVMTVREQTTTGTTLLQINEPIGTLVPTSTRIPAQQNASGLGGEVQLAWKNFAVAGGYTPYGFLISTETGRMMWKPENGPFTFSFNRDSVKDSQLSYAGLRDPSGETLGTSGQIWGGVMANAGNVQYARGDAQSGFYLGAGYQYLSGYKVETNQRMEGSGGAYWRALALPEYGNLNIGLNFFAMHYAHNENAFTHGMGGYFSPQAYFLASVPLSWTGHYGTRWHYDILGSMGVQAFQEEKAALWPLLEDNAMEISSDNAALPAKTSVGANYDLRSHMAYQVSPHWFVGGFVSANNTRDYSAASAGFSVRYLFRSQPSTAIGPTGLFPTDGLRPFNVP